MKTTKQKRGRHALLPNLLQSGTSELAQLAAQFSAWLRVKNFSPQTVRMRTCCLNHFVVWCERRAVSQVAQLTEVLVQSYLKYLESSLDRDGKTMTVNNRVTYLVALDKFVGWLLLRGLLAENPCAELAYPKRRQRLPSNVLSHAQIERVIAQADVTSRAGIRDRAIMELFYSSGIRRTELTELLMGDVDLVNGLAYIRHGKGGKVRMVPVGERACAWVNKYVEEVRTTLCAGKEQNHLFVVIPTGKPLRTGTLGLIMQRYVRQAGYRGCCHIFRHAMATQMLEHGADIRHIQEMLGHESISSTQIYTHATTSKVTEVYTQTHPGADFLPAQAGEDLQPLRPQTEPPRPRNFNKPWPQNHMASWAKSYLDSLLPGNYSQRTLTSTRRELGLFLRWCEERSLTTPQNLSSEVLEHYHSFLASRQEPSLSQRYIRRLLMTVCQWCTFLYKKHLIATDIKQAFHLPVVRRVIPPQVLTVAEVCRLLEQPDQTYPLGIRDRAILETLYATGIRRSELLALEVRDIHFEQGNILIRHGKGGKDRLVPITSQALSWITVYLEQVRPLLVPQDNMNTLFLGRLGRPLTADVLAINVKKYMQAAEIKKPGSCHLLRHSMASHMLDRGADIRYIQEILGHSDLESTQIYTKVSIRKLKEVHTQTHPAKAQPSQHQDMEPNL